MSRQRDREAAVAAERQSLEQKYQECLEYFGESFHLAEQYNNDVAREHERHVLQQQADVKAQQRHRSALQRLNEERAWQEQERVRRVVNLTSVRDAERAREAARVKSAHVTKAPPAGDTNDDDARDRVVAVRLPAARSLEFYASTCFHRDLVCCFASSRLDHCDEPLQLEPTQRHQRPEAPMPSGVEAARREQERIDAEVKVSGSICVDALIDRD